ncbi:leptin receptor isoform X1, partial [Pelobates cultripes]
KFIRIAALHTEIYRLPPSGSIMTCMLTNTSYNNSTLGRTSQNATHIYADYDFLNSSRTFRCQDILNVNTQEQFSCCVWDDIYSNYSRDNEFDRTKDTILAYFSSDIQLLGDFEVDTWQQERLHWMNRYESIHLVHEIHSQPGTRSAEQSAVVVVPLLEGGHLSWSHSLLAQNNSRESVPCNCLSYPRCVCFLPFVNASEGYVLWLHIFNDTTEFVSPGMAVSPSNIVKTNPPDELKMEITEQGTLKVLWSKPKFVQTDLQYLVKHYTNTSVNGTQVFNLVNETSLIIENVVPCSTLLVEVRCKSLHNTSIWSDWSSPAVFNPQDVIYFPQKVLASSGSNVSVHCIYCDGGRVVPSKEIRWWFNLAEKISDRQYSVVSEYAGKVSLTNLNKTKPKGKFNYDVLHCCIQSNKCHHRYAEIHVLDTNINISCQTEGRQTAMTCRWDAKQIPIRDNISLELKYYRNKVYCSETHRDPNASSLADCLLQRDGFYECIFQSVYILSGYTMWIEIKHPLGILHSPPVCVMPIDVVKPLAPSRVEALITEGNGDLYVSWKRPALPAYELQYQIQYGVQGKETQWEFFFFFKMIDISKNESITVQVKEICASYTVHIRCRRSDGSGYWSDWSGPVHTVLKDIRAPLKGPDFWRIIQNNPIQKGENVTLLWQPLAKEYSLCSIRRYKVYHQTPKNASWSEDIEDTTTYAFTMMDDVQTVTVLAINSLGCSYMNRHLTFSHKISAVSAVRSFSVYLINSSCVVAMWTLLPSLYTPSEFVVEWRNLRKEADVRWTFIPANVTRYYIEDVFFIIEKYVFSLYPIFPEGVGSPTFTYGFTNVDLTEPPNDTGLYVILPIIILSSLLLAGTLMVSHQRMKQMFWKDVPNPKYCSWAQGVNFQKPDTLENLFIKHHEHLAPNSVYLLEPETSFENLSIDKAFQKEHVDDISIVNGLFTVVDDPDHDSACATSSSCVYEDGVEETIYTSVICQSSVKYASIINNPQQRENYINERKVSASSFDGCFLENKTLVIGNLEDEQQSFIILSGLQPKQPSKQSSNSTVSSEGFSEPSDHEESFADFCNIERSLYYIGLDSSQQSEAENYFSENPLETYPFQENIPYKQMDFIKDTSSEFITNSYDNRGSVKNVISYMPQFQVHPTKLQGMSE